MKPALLLIAALLLNCCSVNAKANEPGDGKKEELNGNVTHAESKKPLKDVTVTAYLVSKKEKVIKTDKLGVFSFDELKPGTYKFIFEKSGYKRITKNNVQIKTDESFQLNIEMIEQKEFDILPSPFYFTGGIY
jgi:hypothetical protein